MDEEDLFWGIAVQPTPRSGTELDFDIPYPSMHRGTNHTFHPGKECSFWASLLNFLPPVPAPSGPPCVLASLIMGLSWVELAHLEGDLNVLAESHLEVAF